MLTSLLDWPWNHVAIWAVLVVLIALAFIGFAWWALKPSETRVH